MEVQLKSTSISYLEPVAAGGRNLEQTQQIRLPDGMPDVERIIGCWGQTVLRSKEWRSDTLTAAGGVLVWVLYQPEDGSQVRALDGWISFQGKWDLPEDCEDGHMLVQSVLRSLDARPVSPRKILVRAGIGLNCLALTPKQAELYQAEQVPEDVQLLRRQYPLRLYAEAGEKNFALEDSTASQGDGQGKLIACTVLTNLTDQKVVGDKIAFRGSAEVTGLLLDGEGKLREQRFTLPFSQIVELDRPYGNDGEADIQLCVTNFEAETDQAGEHRLRVGLTAQYALSDVTMAETLEDGYSTRRPLKMTWDTLELTPILERRWETLSGEAELPEDADNAIDLRGTWDLPTWERTEDGFALEAQGTAQMLYQTGQGLNGAHLRWEGMKPMAADGRTKLALTALQPVQPQLSPGAGRMTGECRFQVTSFSGSGIPVVTSIELGEPESKDASRPSLILCRAGEKGLWELAKDNGSTVEAIRTANKLEGEPEPGKMLLIPVE